MKKLILSGLVLFLCVKGFQRIIDEELILWQL